MLDCGETGCLIHWLWFTESLLVTASRNGGRSSPSPTSPEARIGSRRREGGAVGSSDGLIEGSESLPSLGLCQSRVLGLCRQSFFSGLSLSIFCLCGMILSVSSLKKGTSTWRKSCSDIGWNLSYDMSGGMRKPVVTYLWNNYYIHLRLSTSWSERPVKVK